MTDSLPDEPGGYDGFQALFGHKYLTPQLAAAANSGGNRVVNGDSYPVFDAQGNLTDLNGNTMRGNFKTPAVNAFTPGFPGFGPISASQTLAYTADMLETGVPVVYGYISDAHERKGQGPTPQSGCTNPSTSAPRPRGRRTRVTRRRSPRTTRRSRRSSSGSPTTASPLRTPCSCSVPRRVTTSPAPTSAAPSSRIAPARRA